MTCNRPGPPSAAKDWLASLSEMALQSLPAWTRVKVCPAMVMVPARLVGKKGGKLPEDVFTPIPYIVPAQLFAAALAEEKGLNPDQPRSLEKVTRTM